LLCRAELDQIVDVKDARLRNQSLDRHRPRPGNKSAGLVGNRCFIGREFVKVIVVGDVLKWSFRIRNAVLARDAWPSTLGALTRRGRGLCRSGKLSAAARLPAARGQSPVQRASSGCCPCQYRGADERPAVEVRLLVRYLILFDVIWLLYQHNL